MFLKFKNWFNFRNSILLIIFLLFFFLLRWNSFSAPFERDEGEYAYSAWIMRQGLMPYENSFMQKPPMIIYTYMIGQIFDSTGIVSPRILVFLSLLITTLLLGIIAWKNWGVKAFWITIFLVTPMLALPINTPFAANIENFMLLPLMGLIAVYTLVNKSSLWAWFLAGILTSVTILYKPVALPIIGFILSVWIFESYKDLKNLRTLLVRLSLLVLGGVMTTILVLLPFLLTQTIDKLIESAFTYNLSYAGFEGFGISNIFKYFGGRYIRYYWPLYLFLGYFLYKRPKKWWFWFGLLISSLLSVYSSPMGHYYILIMPFWALIAAWSLSNLVKSNLLKKYLSKNALWFITTLVIVIIVFPFRMQLGKTPKDLSVWVYGTVNPFVDAVEVGRQLKSVTSKDDYVFVAGSEPQIYFYAKRKSPTRFVITYPLNITSGFRERYQSELIGDLEKNPPQAIVVSNFTMSGLWNEGSPRILIDYLENLINKEYKLVGGYIWGTRGGYWLDNLTKVDIQNSSLLLYKKILKNEKGK
jgi:4-amino-4-deoxy-L-arabinose transferase-like glycosyltransferase